MAIKNSLIVSELPELDSNSEIVWANLHFANAKSIYLASYYRTPNAGPASLEDLNVSLSSLFSKHPRQVPKLVIGGDFNLGNIDWETTPTIQRTRSIHDKFLQLLMEHSLVQLNRYITRPASKKCLDYVVTSNQNLVSNIEVFPGVSDHLIVAFNIDMKPHHSVKPQRKIFVFKKANNDLLKEDVSRFSAQFLSSNPQENSVNENWLIIKQTLTALMHEHVPSKLSRTRHHLPWIDFTLKRQMRRRDRMFSKARKTNSPRLWTAYRTLRNKIAKEVRRSHTKYLNEVVGGSLQDNPKTFWSYVRLMKTENINIPPLKLDGKMHATDSAKATALNSQFKSVFNVEDSSYIPNKGSSPYPDIDHLEIGLEGVAKQFNNINPNKASGPDELPARLLKTVSSEIAPLMQFLFQQSYNQGCVPEDWNKAIVTAIHK